MDLLLTNTRTRQRETFKPQNPEHATLYVCGPTVYNYAHIGNARPSVVFGILARLLKRQYPRTTYARNITDVEDKINAAALAEKVPIETITARYTAAFHDDMAALGVEPPDIEPKVTATMVAIVRMIEKLIALGHAYAAEGHVLFAVETYADYGRLSGRPREEMLAGARVEVAPYKRYPGDFVLWKPSPTTDLPGWDSPWGRGRPGWHIECSAMCEAHLGESIDIHCGGNDLLFPHHENEVAQSTCAHAGKIFAHYWLHNGFVTVEGRKMSKSLGNVLLIAELRKTIPPEALRYFLMNAHYRQPLDWSDATLAQIVKTLDRLYGTLQDLENVVVAADDAKAPENFLAALHDDLNTPKALAVLAETATEARKAAPAAQSKRKGELLGAAKWLGLLQQSPDSWFEARIAQKRLDKTQIQALVEQRQAAKVNRDYAEADRLRQQLAELGVRVEDTPKGPRWRIEEQ